MKVRKPHVAVGLLVVAAVVAVAEWQFQSVTIAYRYLRLKGQAPSHERLVETSTGGTPYFEPIQYREKDSRPAVTEPTFVAAADSRIAGGTKGIGVSINGDSRFYPLNVLQYHQIVNDTCGGKPIACSF